MECRPTSLGRRDWDAAVTAHGGALQQCWDWGRACGGRALRLEVVDCGRILAFAQVIGRRLATGLTVGLLSRGPVLAEVNADPRAVIAALGWRGPLFVTPPAGVVAGGLPLMTPATLAVWDLRPPEDALRAGLDQKWRNRLVRAESSGLDVCEGGDLEWILDREGEMRAARRYRGLPRDFVAALCRAPGSNMILTVRRGDATLAAGLFLIHGMAATYQIGWSGAEGRAANAMTLVLWQAALRLRARGVAALDLDVIDTVTSPGLARFKLGTGAGVQRLGPTTLLWPRAWKMKPRKFSSTCAARIAVLPDGS